MQLVRKLLSLRRAHSGRNQKIRGLSTAELVGIIVIIGILGALGGTYIGSLITTAKGNTLNQNVQSLNTITASMLAAGVPITGSSGNLTVNGTAYATDADLVAALNSPGIVDPNNAGVLYKLSPNVKTPANYVETITADGSGNVTAITWAPATGATNP